MSHRITFIPGDGVGPEVTAAASAIKGEIADPREFL